MAPVAIAETPAPVFNKKRDGQALEEMSDAIDEVNVGLVVAQAKGCIIAEKPFVLDLSGVTSFAAQGIALLDAIDEACYAAGDEWSLIVSQPVSRSR